MNFENEMSQIKGGYWILTEKGWKWVDVNHRHNIK